MFSVSLKQGQSIVIFIHKSLHFLETFCVFEVVRTFVLYLVKKLQFMPQMRVILAKFCKDRNPAIGAEPATASVGTLVYWRQKVIFNTFFESHFFSITILFQKTDLLECSFVLHSRKSSRFINGYPDILDDTLFPELSIIAVDGLYLEIPVGYTLSSHNPSSECSDMFPRFYDGVKESQVVFL